MSAKGHPSHANPTSVQAPQPKPGPPRTLIRKSSAARVSIATQASPTKDSASASGSKPQAPWKQRKQRITEGIQTSPPPTTAAAAATPTQSRYQPLIGSKKKGPTTTARRRKDRADESEGEAPHGLLPDTASSSAGVAQGWSEHSTEEGSKPEDRSKASWSEAVALTPRAPSGGLSNTGWELWDALLDEKVTSVAALPMPKVARYDPLAEYRDAAQMEGGEPAERENGQDVANGGWDEPVEAVTPKVEQGWSSEPFNADAGLGRGRGGLRGAERGGRGRGGAPGAGRGRDLASGTWGHPQAGATGAAPTRQPWGPQAKAAALAAKREGATQATTTGAGADHPLDAPSQDVKPSGGPVKLAPAEAPSPVRAPQGQGKGSSKPASAAGLGVKSSAPSAAPRGSQDRGGKMMTTTTTGAAPPEPRIRDVVKASGPADPASHIKKPKVDLTRPVENAPMAEPWMSWDAPSLPTDPCRVPPAKDKVQAWAASQSAMEQPTPGEDPNEIPPSTDSQSNAGSAFLGLGSSISSRYSDDACSDDDESQQALKGMADLTVGGAAPLVKRLAPWEAKAARNAAQSGGSTPYAGPPRAARDQDDLEALHAFDQSGRRGRGAPRGRARGQNFMTGFVGRGRGLPVVGQTPRAFGAAAGGPTAGVVIPPHLVGHGSTGSSSPAPPESTKQVSKASSALEARDAEVGGPRAEAQALVEEDAEKDKPKVRMPVASAAGLSTQGMAGQMETKEQGQEEAPKSPEPTGAHKAEVALERSTCTPQGQAQEFATPGEIALPPPPPPRSMALAPSSMTLSSILSQILAGHAIDSQGSIWDLQVVPPVIVGSCVVKEQLEILPVLAPTPTAHMAATAPASTVASRVSKALQPSASAPASAVVHPTEQGRAPSRLSVTSAKAAAFQVAPAARGLPVDGGGAVIYGGAGVVAGSATAAATGWGGTVAPTSYEAGGVGEPSPASPPIPLMAAYQSPELNPCAPPAMLAAAPPAVVDGAVYYATPAPAGLAYAQAPSHPPYGYEYAHPPGAPVAAQTAGEYGWPQQQLDGADGWA